MAKAKKNTLSSKQVLAIGHLVNGCSQTETAKRVGVARQTVSRWMSDDDFKTALRKVESKHLDQLARQYQSVEEQVFETYLEILNDPEARRRVRIAAGRMINKNARRYRELRLFEERFAQVEKFMQRQEKLNQERRELFRQVSEGKRHFG